MRFARPATMIILASLLAGCETTPKPAATVAPTPPPKPVAAPAGPVAWADLPVTPGTWRYDAATSAARFGGATPEVELRCDKATRTIVITRKGGTALTIQTSYGIRTIATPIAANDPLLDQIAFSRGRFTIESPGTPMIVMPAWAEPARVFEDCRG